MANREQGEVSVTVKGKSYIFLLTTNAMVQLEDLFSTPERELRFQQIMERVSAGSIRYMRGFIWACLQKYHPEMTVLDAGQLIEDAGGIIAFSAQLEALVESTTPDQRDLKDLGVSKTNPPKARTTRRRGTGGRSISQPVAPV